LCSTSQNAFSIPTTDSAETTMIEMKNRNYSPDVSILSQLITDYFNCNKANDALAVYHQMEERFGVFPDVEIFKQVISHYSSMKNHLNDAVTAFQFMKTRNIQPTLSTMNSLIGVYLKNDEFSEAKSLLDSFPNYNITPNVATFHAFIKYYAEKGDLTISHDWFADMISQNIQPDILIIISLLHGYLNTNRLSNASHLVDNMESQYGIPPNALILNSMLLRHTLNRDVAKSKQILQVMQEKKIQPELSKIGPLITFLFKEDRPDEALELFHGLKDRFGVTPNGMIFEDIIKYHLSKRKLKLVLKCFEDMQQLKIKPNRVTCNTTIDVFLKNYKVDMAKSVLEMMRTKFEYEDTTHTHNLFLIYYTAKSEMKKATTVLDTIKKKNLKPDIVSYEKLICAFSIQSSPKAFDLYYEMKKYNIKPNKKIFNALIKFCRTKDLPKRETEFIREMQQMLPGMPVQSNSDE